MFGSDATLLDIARNLDEIRRILTVMAGLATSEEMNVRPSAGIRQREIDRQKSEKARKEADAALQTKLQEELDRMNTFCTSDGKMYRMDEIFGTSFGGMTMTSPFPRVKKGEQ